MFLRPDRDPAAEVRRDVVAQLCPRTRRRIGVTVDAGAVTCSGEVTDSAVIPLAARLARAVEGVADIRCGPTIHRPDP